nr:hypothetical protein [Burkholderia pseudomallei]
MVEVTVSGKGRGATVRRGAGAPGRRDRAIACSGIGSERRAWHRTMVDAPTAVRALAAFFGRGAIGLRATRVFPGARGRILRAMSHEFCKRRCGSRSTI